MLPNNSPTPAAIIGELLRSHPEAESLLAEASHRRALAVGSADESAKKFATAQAARHGYETLWRRLEPRRTRLLHFDVGLLLLIVPSCGIALLGLYELGGVRGGDASAVPLALSDSAVWLTLAWLAAAAARRRAWLSLCVTIGAAMALGLLLAAMHMLAPGSGWLPGRGAVLSAALAAALTLGLATGAGAVISCMEPASLLVARRYWHRARADYNAAERTQQADLEAAAIASEAWLELARVRVLKISDGDERLVKEATLLAAGLVKTGRPQLRSAS